MTMIKMSKMSKFRFYVIKITPTHYVVWDNRKGKKRNAQNLLALMRIVTLMI